MYHSLRNWCWIQQMNYNNSRTIYVLLILSFSVYRRHGPARINLLKSQLKKLGMVSKKLYRNTLSIA